MVDRLEWSEPQKPEPYDGTRRDPYVFFHFKSMDLYCKCWRVTRFDRDEHRAVIRCKNCRSVFEVPAVLRVSLLDVPKHANVFDGRDPEPTAKKLVGVQTGGVMIKLDEYSTAEEREKWRNDREQVMENDRRTWNDGKCALCGAPLRKIAALRHGTRLYKCSADFKHGGPYIHFLVDGEKNVP